MRRAIFDQKELKILSYVHMRANAPIGEIAEATRLKTHTIRYALKSLNERNILFPFVMIHRKCLGYDSMVVYSKIKPAFAEKRPLILEAIRNHPMCSWLGPLVGDFEFGITLGVKSLSDSHKFFNSLSDQFGPFWGERVCSIDKAWYYLGKKYLLGSGFNSNPLVVNDNINKVEVDETDLLILKALSKSPLASDSLIAKQLSLPHSTVNNRIQKLKDKCVIGGFIYGMNYSKANISAYRIIIDFGGLSTSFQNQFLEFAKVHPNIVALNLRSGCYDVELSVEFQGSQAIQEFIRELKGNFKDYISSMKVLNRMDHVKWSML